MRVMLFQIVVTLRFRHKKQFTTQSRGEIDTYILLE